MHARWIYDTLMRCAAATLTEFAANLRWLGGVGAFTLVLHTWTQDLRRHPHVHALMACGALRRNPAAAAAAAAVAVAAAAADVDVDVDAETKPDDEAAAIWLRPRRSERLLFPVQALSRVFRGKFLAALGEACSAGALPGDPANTPALRQVDGVNQDDRRTR